MQNSWENTVVNFLLLALGPTLVILGTLIRSLVSSFPESIGLAVEHLGIGVFAVMILKMTLEKATQTEFFGALRAGLSSQIKSHLQPLQDFGKNIGEGLTQVENQLQPLQDSIKTLAERLTYNPNPRVSEQKTVKKPIKSSLLKQWLLTHWVSLGLPDKPHKIRAIHGFHSSYPRIQNIK